MKLRCREINFLLSKLQESLLQKMKNEGTMGRGDKMAMARNEAKKEEDFLEKMLKEKGLVRLENGRVAEKGERGEKGEIYELT